MRPTLVSRPCIRFCLALACLISLLAFAPNAAHADTHVTVTMPATGVAGQPITGTVTGTSVGADALTANAPTAVKLMATLVTPQGQTTVLTPTSTSLNTDGITYTLKFTYTPASGGTLTVMAQVAVTSAQPFQDQAIAAVTGLPSVTVSSGNTWQPNPGSVNQPITSTVPATVSNPYQSPNGDTISQHWTWTTDGVYESDTGMSGSFTPYGGNSTVTWSEGSPSTLFTGTFGDVGYYIVKVTATLTYHDDTTNTDVGTYSGDGYIGGVAADLAPPPASPTAHVMSAHQAMQPHDAGAPPPAPDTPTGIPIPPTVTLPSLIKLGLYSLNNAIVKITVPITPAAKAGTVTFSLINSEATLNVGTPDANGNVILTLTAVSITPALPANLPNGDERLVAKFNGNSVATANVLVLEPCSLDPTPYFGELDKAGKPTGAGTQIQPEKILENNKTLPGTMAVTFPMVGMDYFFGTKRSMQVRDQFGQALDGLFLNTDVSEQWKPSENPGLLAIPKSSINSPILIDGTYIDTVGFVEVTGMTSADKDSGLAKNWPGPINQAPPYASTSADTTNSCLRWKHRINSQPCCEANAHFDYNRPTGRNNDCFIKNSIFVEPLLRTILQWIDERKQ